MVSATRGGGARRVPGGPVVRAAAVVVVLAVVAIAAAAALGLGPWRDDNVEPRLDSIEVEAADVFEGWNESVAARGVGDTLPDPAWVPDEELGLDVAEHVLDTWGVVTLYRHPDQRLAAVDLLGSYATASDRGRMTDTVVTVVSAVSRLPVDEVERFVAEELGFGSDRGAPGGSAELDGVRYTVERTPRTAQLRVTTASTAVSS